MSSIDFLTHEQLKQAHCQYVKQYVATKNYPWKEYALSYYNKHKTNPEFMCHIREMAQARRDALPKAQRNKQTTEEKKAYKDEYNKKYYLSKKLLKTNKDDVITPTI
jgi:hypothetical protein